MSSFNDWFYPAYEAANGYVSSGDPMMYHAMQCSAGWARQAWERQQAEIDRLREALSDLRGLLISADQADAAEMPPEWGLALRKADAALTPNSNSTTDSVG